MDGEVPTPALPDASQALLFSLPEDIQRALNANGQRELTGEGVRLRNPQLYDVVCKLGKLGCSWRLAAKLTGLSKNTIGEIYEKSVGTAAIGQELVGMLRRNLFMVMDEMAQRLADGAHLIKDSDLSVWGGILGDKLVALTGGPQLTVNVKHEHSAPGFESLLKELRMGLGGGSLEQRAAGAIEGEIRDLPASAGAGGGLGLPGASLPPIDVTADNETAALPHSNRDGGSNDTGYATDEGAKRVGDQGGDFGQAGGEGGRGSGAPEGGRMDLESRNLGQSAKAFEPSEPSAGKGDSANLENLQKKGGGALGADDVGTDPAPGAATSPPPPAADAGGDSEKKDGGPTREGQGDQS